jgi:beta-galactosidase/beta-glucuronidase
MEERDEKKRFLLSILISITHKPHHIAFSMFSFLGFRTAALVTINETDESTMGRVLKNDSEGSGSHGMYFRINGAVVTARGANFIPMDQLEGRLTDEAHQLAVSSAVAANMNMLRIWGGGMVLPNAFYEACDEGGILLYHDMMFVDEEGHGPSRTETIQHEIRHLVRSLAPHPSIVLWNGCNECSVVMGTPTEIYATFVMQTVAEEDDTRSIWPSSPSKSGWATGVYTIDSRPNGNPLSTKEQTYYDAHVAESHGPYQHSFSTAYPAVNGQDFHS